MVGVGFLLAAGVLSGCASVLQGDSGTGGSGGGGGGTAPGPGPYEHPIGAEEPVVSVSVSGGFLPVEASLRTTAQLLLLGDGTVVVPGVTTEIYPGPALYPLQAATVTEEQIQELIKAADDAGLLDGEIDYGQPPIADAPDTTVELTVDGRTVTQSAYALDEQDENSPGISDDQLAARTALRGFIDTAQGLGGQASESYVPTGVVAYWVNIESMTPVEDPALDQPAQTWPITTAPTPPTGSELTSCVAVTGEEVGPLLEALVQANELTPWTIGSEPAARMVFRPQLPGDPGCNR